MIGFLKRGASQDEPRLQDIADELARIRTLLETHCKEHADLPHQVWERILAEVNNAARDATTAVWITVRRKIWDEFTKWAWRAVFGYLGLQAIQLMHGMLGNVHSGISP